MKDIQVFLRFANFYQYFIQGFSKIIALFISMLKITKQLVVNQKFDKCDEENKYNSERKIDL